MFHGQTVCIYKQNTFNDFQILEQNRTAGTERSSTIIQNFKHYWIFILFNLSLFLFKSVHNILFTGLENTENWISKHRSQFNIITIQTNLIITPTYPPNPNQKMTVEVKLVKQNDYNPQIPIPKTKIPINLKLPIKPNHKMYINLRSLMFLRTCLMLPKIRITHRLHTIRKFHNRVRVHIIPSILTKRRVLSINPIRLRITRLSCPMLRIRIMLLFRMVIRILRVGRLRQQVTVWIIWVRILSILKGTNMLFENHCTQGMGTCIGMLNRFR